MKRRRFAGYIGEKIDYPESSFIRTPVISLEGDNSLEIEGCQRILDMNDMKIQLDMGDFRVSVVGVNMTLLNLSKDTMTITGTIHSISLTEE